MEHLTKDEIFDDSISPEPQMLEDKKQELLSRLNDTLQADSLGVLLSDTCNTKEINILHLSEISGIQESVLFDLLKDRIYTNSVPIILLKNMLIQLDISFRLAEPAILKTFKIMKARGIPNHSPYSQLYENEDATLKYLKRLSELMPLDSLTPPTEDKTI